ncbi:DNA sulfur modification protein DndB [Priestia megaterium]|uniref:DNA sulfur modification protein DndB n=1 Tax=Priestia megaterium TaxID=1404 RepID=UPI002447D94C|nr:DNA sulfur modification protein DndB [Priestia megaterium]MDH2452142.1 DNA sulfur modification protein DndB [Priestia megaterium]MDL5151599.1 DNA sulfur modification protein DndB [Priestia megaterium]
MDFSKEFSKAERTTVDEGNKGIKIKVQIYRQAKRIVYRTVLSFKDVATHLTHTTSKPEDHDALLANIENLTNRYLNPKKGKEIMKYIQENEDDFILPSITVMAKEEFAFTPIFPSLEDIQKVYDSEIDLSSLRYRIFDVLEKFNGVLFGEIFIPYKISKALYDKNVIFETGDGNHRTFAIHELVRLTGDDNPGFYIGVDFYVEKSTEKIKEMFVDLNNQTSIDRSIYSFLKGKDPLSLATKELIGLTNKTYMVNHFFGKDKNYIGFSPVDNVGANSKATVSFNMVKNIVSYIAFGVDTGKGFEEKFPEGSSSYNKLLRETSSYLKIVFNNMPPFMQVKGDLNRIPDLRNKYISMSGAGLYVIAKIGYIAREQNSDLEKVAMALCKLDWKREVSPNNLNPLFVGGILDTSGNVSNTRNALNATTVKIMKALNDSVKTNN